jgi:hypothetical protein
MHKEPEADAEGWIEEVAQKLHDLAQPLTSLQCRLEISMMDGGEAEMRAAIGEALRECERLNERVYTMQMVVRNAMKAGKQERS